ncbi:SMI1/KNR4 family protein [Mesorhizobium sp. CU2]|uniref:SMI1/KNR4 family protein n=1 Tax=unclassified Mesorhizobium TaxID=325217 RepID=UPI00112BF159|nr:MULTISPECIES: SMI1/KNR4 family protein [unclassified Mesorhizobium]TPN79531.1 SMI1/KNR4 family protein [Mesorhizobium sp. CU3]TPO20004.1 SMI1/KNR4 family protein [Mesorhizobium sp. CU2]
MSVIDEFMNEFAREDGFYLGLHQRQFDPVAAERALQILRRVEFGADHGANYRLISILYEAEVQLGIYAYFNRDDQEFNKYNDLIFSEITDRFNSVRTLGETLTARNVGALLECREWRKNDGASEAAIGKLWGVSPMVLPQSYFSFLVLSNGGEGPLPVQPWWFVLDPAEEVIETVQAGRFKEFFPGLFVIGGNGAGQAIAFDLRSDGSCPVVAFDMTNSNFDESVLPIAPDFDTLIEMIGLSGE